MTIEWENNLDFDNYTSLDIKNLQKEVRTTNPSQKETKEQYAPLKVYEIKNSADVWFGISSQCSLDKDGLHFVVNGPLVEKDWQPVGWYTDNMTLLKEYIDPALGWWNFAVDNWIFGYWNDWKLHLIPYKELWKSTVQFQWSFQNWPMLIQNGKNLREHSTSTSKYNRSGIWFTASWKAIIIYSDKPVTFKEFAQFFVDQWCTNAIYLDWWPYAWYGDPTGSFWKLNPTAKKLQFFHQH